MSIRSFLHHTDATPPAGAHMGLGLAALGRPGYINLGHHRDLPTGREVRAMEQHTHRVLDAAYAAGVRYFDAARSYGRAESFLTTWLQKRGLAPGQVSVGSKWGYTYTANWQVNATHHEIKDHSLAQLERQWTESRSHLGQHLGLYQIHSAKLETGVLEDTEVLHYLAHLKREGVHIGLSLSGPGQGDTLRRALAVELDGLRLFDAVQATWNLLERSAEPALREAHAAGLGIIIKEALANGRLTPRNERPGDRAWQEAVSEQAARLGAGLDALALATVLQQPWVDLVLSGAATADHLRSNLQALPLSAKALPDFSSLTEAPETYWQTRQGLAWN